MRRISMAARDELVAAIAGRYAQGDRAERGRILDEFAAVTGFHRKHAMRLAGIHNWRKRGGERFRRRRGRARIVRKEESRKASSFRRGTEGSNPSRSGKESVPRL